MLSVGWIYVLVDPRTGEIRYVGWTYRSLKRRLAEHMYVRANEHNHRAHWLALLKQLGMRPFMRVLQSVPLTEAKTAERYWIDYFRNTGCILVNNTDGGEGSPGRVVSVSTREKISATKRANPATITVERRAQISTQMKGRVFSTETRAKLSAANKRRVLGPESRAKQAAALRGRRLSAEHRAGIAASLKGIERSDEYRQKQKEAQLKRYRDPAERRRQSAQQLRHPVTEETRQKIRDFWARKRNTASK